MKKFNVLIVLMFLFSGAAVQAATPSLGGALCGGALSPNACGEPQQVASLTMHRADFPKESELPAKNRVAGQGFVVTRGELPFSKTEAVATEAGVPSPEPNVVVLMLVGVALMAFIALRRLD